MKIQTIIHILPTEIDWFEQISVLLKRNSLYLELRPDDIFQINVTLNLNNSMESFNSLYSINKTPVPIFTYTRGNDTLNKIREETKRCP